MSTPSKLDGQRYDPIQCDEQDWHWSPANIRRRSDGDWVPLEVAEELERDNEALRNELEVAKAFHRVAVIERDVARNETKTIAEQYDANEIGAAEVLIHAARLERENAALREALALGQENCDAEYDRLRAERDANKTALAATRSQLAALREDKARLEESLASFYPVAAPVVEHFPVGLWEHMGQGRCRGTWAEDGSAYYFTVPHQLVPAFFALQRLAKLAEEKHAARKEAQP